MSAKQGENQKNAIAGAVLVTQNARLIIEQQAIATIKEIPSLPDHQQAAKVQSKEWLDNIWPLIIQTTADIIDYANTFQSAYEQLLTLVPKLKAGDKKDFIQVLKVVLLQNLQEKKTSSTTIADKIKAFHDNFQPLYGEFLSDFKAAMKN